MLPAFTWHGGFIRMTLPGFQSSFRGLLCWSLWVHMRASLTSSLSRTSCSKALACVFWWIIPSLGARALKSWSLTHSKWWIDSARIHDSWALRRDRLPKIRFLQSTLWAGPLGWTAEPPGFRTSNDSNGFQLHFTVQLLQGTSWCRHQLDTAWQLRRLCQQSWWVTNETRGARVSDRKGQTSWRWHFPNFLGWSESRVNWCAWSPRRGNKARVSWT